MTDFTSQSDILGSLSKHFCTYCQEEISPASCRSYTGYISKIIFIQCEICEEFFLCLACFSCGVEIGSHKNYHNFKLVTFSIANVFSLNLLNALEEWVSEDTEKYLGKKKLVLSWKDVAKVIGVKDPKEVEKEYFDTFIDGNLGQCVINLVNKYVGISQVVTLDRAKEMDCLKNFPFYLPPFKYLKVPKNPDKLEGYEVLEESIRSNQHFNKGMIFRNKNIFDTYKLQLLLQCVGEFGYGNWKNISQLYNRTIQMEYPQNKCTYLTAIQIKEEYLQRFIVSPIFRRTWSQLPNNRPLVPDRTNRIEGPLQLDYYHTLDTKLPIEDLDILIYPAKLDKYENACIVEKVKSDGFKEECLVCTYCQEEFEVISYRTSQSAFSYYELLSVYACCTNKQTCVNFYLCLTCLSSGAEIGKHKNNHSYKLISEVKRYSSEAYFPGSSWTALETLALFSASEEWLSDYTDKYINPLNSGNIITDWDSVAQHIRSKNANEAKTQFEKLILNQRIWKLFEQYYPTKFLMTYEKAYEMGCFDDNGLNNKITTNLTKSNDSNDKQVQIDTKKHWTKFELKLLLEYTAIYGYGNWEKISEELNTAIWPKNNKKIDVSKLKTPKEVAEEYIFRFYDCPMRRRSWNTIKHVEPIIIDRTQFFKQSVDMKYPVVNYNLFAELGYNYATDDFECPYMDIAESHFNVYCSEISADKSSLLMDGVKNNYKHLDENDTKKTENSVSKHNEALDIRKYTNIKEEKALIAFECYNNVLRDRRTAKKIVHDHRLIELFEMYKDKELPKIKPLSEQTFEERLIKMERLMTTDLQKKLVIGIMHEKLLKNIVARLKYVYKSDRSTKFAEIESDNIPLKRKVVKKQTLVDTVPECQTTTNNCLKFTRPSLSKLPYLQNMNRIPLLSNDKCDELLTNSEKLLCNKYNFNSNYFLSRKQDLLINGLRENSSESDCIIHQFLVNFKKIEV